MSFFSCKHNCKHSDPNVEADGFLPNAPDPKTEKPGKMIMATDPDDHFHGFGTRPAGTNTTTVTSDISNHHNRAGGRSNSRSLLPFRHHASSSSEDGSSYRHGGGPFHQGRKLLDRAAKTRGHRSTASSGERGGGVWREHRRHARSQASQGSGSGTDEHSPSDSATSFPAMTKEEFQALPATIQRKVSRKLI
ncbi:hypothetical protein MY11210_002155 [Beauveria gryllotalpidicola]